MPQKELDSQRIAIIDLGSNTFHLLIVEVNRSNAQIFKTILRERQFIFLLGKKNYIDENARCRALQCLTTFQELILKHQITIVKVVATEALRSAKNKTQILSEFEQTLGFPIEIIDGIQEAEFIYSGIRLLDNHFYEPSLIIDIGGGSVEFILGSKTKIYKLISVKAGISFMRNNLVESDPISPQNKLKIYAYLDGMLDGFFEVVKTYRPIALIGSSGPFEIIESIEKGHFSEEGSFVFSREVVEELADRICLYDKAQRAGIKNMPASRSDLSLESFLIIKYVLSRVSSIEKIVVSPYGIKEGVISKTLNLE